MADWGVFDGAQRVDAYGAATGTSEGTTITVPGSTNTKGSYTQLTSSTSADAVGLVVSGRISGSAALSVLIDIAVGGSGSEQVIIADMVGVRLPSANSGWAPFFIPISIPAGTRISARYQTTSTSSTLTMSVQAVAATTNYGMVYPRVASYGGNTSTSKGVVVDPGTSANTKGSYVEITSATSFKSSNCVIIPISETAALEASWLFDIAIGGSGSEQVIASNIQMFGNSTAGTTTHRLSFPLVIPAGVRVAVRAQCSSTASGRTFQVTMHLSG